MVDAVHAQDTSAVETTAKKASYYCWIRVIRVTPKPDARPAPSPDQQSVAAKVSDELRALCESLVPKPWVFQDKGLSGFEPRRTPIPPGVVVKQAFVKSSTGGDDQPLHPETKPSFFQAEWTFFGGAASDVFFDYGPAVDDLQVAKCWIYSAEGQAWAKESENYFLMGLHMCS